METDDWEIVLYGALGNGSDGQDAYLSKIEAAWNEDPMHLSTIFMDLVQADKSDGLTVGILAFIKPIITSEGVNEVQTYLRERLLGCFKAQIFREIPQSVSVGIVEKFLMKNRGNVEIWPGLYEYLMSTELTADIVNLIAWIIEFREPDFIFDATLDRLKQIKPQIDLAAAGLCLICDYVNRRPDMAHLLSPLIDQLPTLGDYLPLVVSHFYRVFSHHHSQILPLGAKLVMFFTTFLMDESFTESQKLCAMHY